VINTEGLKL